MSGRLTFVGSTTVQPLAARLGEAFKQHYPAVVLDIAAGGTKVGIQAVHDGTADIGMASRALKPEEATGIQQQQIALDVIAVVVHKDNPTNGLSMLQLHDIYVGSVDNWRDVGGPDMPIVVVTRAETSGTRGAFDELVLAGQSPGARNLKIAITAGDDADLVAMEMGDIGYVGFGNIDNRLKVLAIEGVPPTRETARDGTYPLTRPLSLLTGPLSQPLAQLFIDYAISAEGQKVVEDSGWLAAQ